MDGRMTAGAVHETDGIDFVQTGPGTLAGRYLRTFWQPILVASDLSTSWPRPIRTMGESLTLYRGESGACHLLAFRCAHRGTQLSSGWVEGDDLRCRYHGWKYDASGRCIEQPTEPNPFCEQIRIQSYPVQEYLGLIFAYLGEDEPPPMRRFPALEADGTLEAEIAEVVPCNFFNRIDNGPDQLHTVFTHRGMTRQDSIALPALMEAHERDYGLETVAIDREGGRHVVRFYLPNISYFGGGAEGAAYDENLQWRMPVDDETYVTFTARLIPARPDAAAQGQPARRSPQAGKRFSDAELADRVLRGEARLDDLKGEPNLIRVQDYVMQVGQGWAADRTAEHLGSADTGIVALREIWRRELRAVAEGRPLTRWAVP